VPGPMWMKNKSQPIATQNVIDYLFAALTNPNGRGGVFEIGGPDIHTYGDLMVRYASARGLKRTMFLIPGIPISLMAFGVGLMTPVPYPIAYALIGGLSADSIVKHPDALKVFPEVNLIDFDAATQKALRITHPDHIERVWDDTKLGINFLKHEGCFILHSSGLRELIPAASKLADSRIDSRIEQHTPFGELWFEANNIFFSPRGLPGFLYWYLLYPFHLLRFRGLMRKHMK
jgi:hypothetical protein